MSGEGNRTSFFKLFAEHDFKIVIPMLQREYAQGRESAKEIRTEFLKALYVYLDEGIPNRDLDFIYGNVADKDFIPLDGQQRLTTLFLLHWYLSRITSDISLREQFDSVLLDEEKQHCRFTYKTRRSSQEFCDALMLNTIDFSNLLLIEIDKRKGIKNESVKATIEDQNWFHLSWNFDPSIVAMLNMLDAIHDLFKGRPDFLSKLIDTKFPVITFLFMELDKYHLSDDLYIKMNSRGKPLTDFENFKARYAEHIEVLLRDKGNMITRNRKLKDGTTLSLPLDRYFAERIDNRWTNMLWAYRKDGETDTSDDYGQICDWRMANLIRVLLSLKYIELHPQVKGEQDATFVALANQSGREPLSFLTLRDGDALSLPASVYLTDAMDILAKNDSKPINLLQTEFQHCLPLNLLMEKILFSPRELNYNDRVTLYAYLGYIMKYGASNGINHWMRIVYNLANAENNRIDSAAELSNTIKSFKALLEVAPSILQYLAERKSVDVFPSWLVEEERMKASLILRENGNKWLDKILEAEHHGYFNGQIGFILEFTGIWDYFQKEHSTDWSTVDDNEYFERFIKYSKDAQAAFAGSYENRVNDTGYRFERAVLFKGDYLPSNNLHYNLLSTNAVRNNVKRDFTWKRLLRLDKGDEATERRSFVKAVFDDSAFDNNTPHSSLKAIFNGKSTGEQWRDTLIKYPLAIDYCKQGFISFFCDIEGCEGILPMCSSRLSGYHCELYSWALYCELQNVPDVPFKNGIGYEEQKVNDVLPFLYFDGDRIDHRNHWIAITAETNPEDWSLIRFRMEFIQGGTQKKSEALDNLNDLLISEGFCYSADEECMRFRYLDDMEAAIEYIPKLFNKLSNLGESSRN